MFLRIFVSRFVQDEFGHGEGEAEKALVGW